MAQSIPQKQCSHCKELFLSTDEFFHRDKGKRDGLSSRCKTCARAIAKQWADEHPEQNRQRAKSWHHANLERAHQSNKRNYDLNTERRRATSKEWYYANPERVRATKHVYRKNNAILINQYNRDWRANNLEQSRETSRTYYATHKDRVRATQLRRRARKMNAEGTFVIDDIKSLHETQNDLCAYCGIRLFNQYEIEHMNPLIRGGSNWPDNLCLSCPSCNRSKSSKTVAEWMAVRSW